MMDKLETQARLNALYQLLQGYDYIGIKIATGRATTAEYADQIAQMDTWAAEINTLEAAQADEIKKETA